MNSISSKSIGKGTLPWVAGILQSSTIKMRLTRTYIWILVGFLLTASCQERNVPKSKSTKADGLQLKIAFRPAFNEKSEIDLVSSDSSKQIQILLRNISSATLRQDTFYWKKIDLTDQQYAELDTTLIKSCRQRLGIHNKLGWVDGMTINSLLINKNDINTIGFFSPDRKNDSNGYFFVESLLGTLGKTFQDSVITEYFDDIEVYIDDSKSHRANPQRKIDRMRMEKYHWTIRNPQQASKKI
jgi:hypothetical protein